MPLPIVPAPITPIVLIIVVRRSSFDVRRSGSSFVVRRSTCVVQGSWFKVRRSIDKRSRTLNAARRTQNVERRRWLTGVRRRAPRRFRHPGRASRCRV
jgi:hypothetical protein